MGHHINEDGFFQSDKHPELPANKITLDFRDIYAQPVLMMYADLTTDEELAEDIKAGVKKVRKELLTKVPD